MGIRKRKRLAPPHRQTLNSFTFVKRVQRASCYLLVEPRDFCFGASMASDSQRPLCVSFMKDGSGSVVALAPALPWGGPADVGVRPSTAIRPCSQPDIRASVPLT